MLTAAHEPASEQVNNALSPRVPCSAGSEHRDANHREMGAPEPTRLELQQHPVVAQGVGLDPLEVEEFRNTDVVGL